MNEEPICPECSQGKHGNCDGAAWDFDADEPTSCACPTCYSDVFDETVPVRRTRCEFCGLVGCVGLKDCPR